VTVLETEGELRHWRADYPSEAWAGHLREDIEGRYYVGDAAFDITELEHLRMWERHYDESEARTLEIELGGQTGMGNEILLRIFSVVLESLGEDGDA
jgi:hypothetical protein